MMESGRVHLSAAMSLDGYLAAPDGSVDWLDPYHEARKSYGAFMKTIGAAIMGRATFDDAVKRGYSEFGDLPNYVVTHRPIEFETRAVAWSGDLRELVETIRGKHPKDIWLMGGGELTKSFADADLIDIWSVAIIPTLLGGGLPMFPPRAFHEQRLRLVDNQQTKDGVVSLRYERL
jgi:dihydrofolate reductase